MKPIPHISDSFLFSAGAEWRRRFCVVGKGPSLLNRPRDLSTSHVVVALNEAANYVSPALVVCNDLEPVYNVQNLARSSALVALPYYPHWLHRPMPERSLADLVRIDLRLRHLHHNNRLFGFDLSCDFGSVPRHYMEHEPLATVYTSAESAIEIIARSGEEVIRTVGIDGGDKRADVFDQVGSCGARSYVAQFGQFNKLENRYGISIDPISSIIERAST